MGPPTGLGLGLGKGGGGSAVAGPNTLAVGLHSYYALGEAAGTNALDSTAGAKTLTAYDAPTSPLSGAGIAGNARVFSAATPNGIFYRSGDTSYKFLGDFTVQVWMKYTVAPAWGTTTDLYCAGFCCYLSEQVGDWWFGVGRNGEINFCYFAAGAIDPAGQKKTAAGTVSPGVWTHCVARKVGTTYTVWVNGANITPLTTSDTGPGTWFSMNQFDIGRMYFQSNQYVFNGSLDEVALWTRGLTDAEITDLYNAGAGRDYSYVSRP